MGTDSDKEETSTPPVTSALAIVGAVAGGAAWVAVVGSFIVATRLEPLGVPTAPTVAVMPTEHRFVVGLSFLAIPLVAAVLAYLVLLWIRPRDTNEAERLNARGAAPTGLVPICVLAVIVGVLVGALSDSATPWARIALVLLPVVAGWLIYQAVARSDGWNQAGVVLFAGVAVYAAAMALLYEAGRTTRLDTSAVLRKDGSVVTGFYLSRSDDAVYLLGATLVGRGVAEPSRTAAATAREPESSDKRCPSGSAATILRGTGDRCFLNELVVIPSDDVRRVVVGPRGVVVDADGYRAAAALGRLAGLPGDEPAPASASR